jgi:hypothetical protein
MTDLSPAAQAVLNAFRSSHTRQDCLVAALRALAVRIKGADNIRQNVLDIADELDGTNHTSENGPVAEKSSVAQPELKMPTDNELLYLMPKTMKDEFSYAAKVCSDATGGQVKPGIFRVALNTAALEYAQVILTRWRNYSAT